MRVNREALLRCLDAVSPGLATRETIEQGACFCFKGDSVITFNDEIACSRVSPLTGMVGAVQAAPLLALLSKLKEEEIDVEITASELMVKGKGRRAGINMEQTISLPIESIEAPGEWKKLDPEFVEAVTIVQECAGKDDSQFCLTCIHISPDYLEACDNLQLARYPVKTGFERDVIVRRDSLKSIIGLDMTEFSETTSWLHFRNPAGLVLSCRRYLEDYPVLDKILDVDGASTVLPGGLAEAVDKAEVFSSENAVGNNVLIDLKPGKMMIEGRGATGWFQEKREIDYKGDPLKFMISPKLLVSITRRANECTVGPGRLLIESGGKFKFVACLSIATDGPA